MNEDTSKTCQNVGALFIGGLIGAAIALLAAPKSGSETRKDIKRAARNAKNYTDDLIEDTMDEVKILVNDLGKRASELIDRGALMSDKVKREIIATLEQGQKTIEKQKRKFSES